jgi:nuclear pore complex protein Nup205
LHSFITTRVNWKASHASDPNPIQPVVQLAWCLFLIQAFRYRPSLINETKIWENVIEDCIIDAIHASALDVCANSLLRFKKPADPFEELGWTAGTRDETSAAFAMAEVDLDFQDAAISRVDCLVESLITNASSILRKVRHREEDILMASSLGRTSGTPSRRRLSSSTRGEQPNNSQTEQRHDIEALFSLIATLYRDAPDAALKYWIEDDSAELGGGDAGHRHSRLSAFLRWASDCRVPSMTRSFFDMLGSLATGPQSATYAFEFLAQNGNGGSDVHGSGQLCSWSSLFDALIFYGTQRSAQEGPTEIPPEEVALLKSFLRLLRIVVSSSAVARAALYDNQRYRPVATLFSLIAQPIPIDLKAALLEGVTAFTKPAHRDEGAGMVSLGVEIARRTWMTLENSQILSTIPQTDGRGVVMKVQPTSGIVLELEQVEAPSRVYPATTAFVTLLVSLLGGSVGLQSTTDVSLALSSMESASTARTIPDNLGSPHRSPAEGISAYTRYVVDEVFLKAQMREYRNVGERWRVTERCLAYIERCLLGLNFDAFLKTPTSSQVGPQGTMQQLLVDPGFDLLMRLLGGGNLLDAIFDLASVELETLDDTSAASTTFVTCVLQALRILQRLFTLQAPFLEVVIPALL